MASDLYTVITRDEAVQRFEDYILPVLVRQATEWQGGTWDHIDECLRSEAWSNFTDMLCKSNEISDWQYENWTHPDCCEA